VKKSIKLSTSLYVCVRIVQNMKCLDDIKLKKVMVFLSHDIPRRLDYRLFYDRRMKKNCEKIISIGVQYTA
jgi:hypothetical protein